MPSEHMSIASMSPILQRSRKLTQSTKSRMQTCAKHSRHAALRRTHLRAAIPLSASLLASGFTSGATKYHMYRVFLPTSARHLEEVPPGEVYSSSLQRPHESCTTPVERRSIKKRCRLGGKINTPLSWSRVTRALNESLSRIT